jgi:hypothetical protein
MSWRQLNLCAANGHGYRARMGRMVGRVAGIWLVCVAGALFGASAASALPTAAVGGVQDPASLGVLDLEVLANETESGVELVSVTALLDGSVADEELLADGTCTVTACPLVVPLTVVTSTKADGIYWLEVVVENSEGEEFLWEREIEIDNTPPQSTPTVTVSVGSGNVVLSPPPGDGQTGPQGTDRGCAAPRLSMSLADDPLRFRRGVPVLVRGRKYRFTGRLTCRVDGRRRPAPRGTEIQVRNRVNGHTITKPSVRVRRNGVIVARLSYRTSRVIVFRIRGAGDSLHRVTIPIRVVKVKRGRR